ncbi:MAG: diadenylate cyclase CdaA [Eubacteriales bacterium]|nr:diadenylate cyclase CdaA [bacterium]MDY2793039.1 diadenylate cyclase CdaA [Eubacteriales bacterium]
MSYIERIWQQFSTRVLSLGASLSWRNALDIALVALLVYYVIALVRQTRANSVLKGLALVLIMAWLSDVMQLSAFNWILRQVINTGVIMLVVLFQPELRRGLEKIGRSKLSGAGLLESSHKIATAEHDADEIVHCMTNLSRRRVGALVVIQNKTGLNDIIATGTMLDAEISSALLENIFEPNTPLHDGAVIMRGGRIVAAACYLPLSENYSISRELGTRHRAAIGISETTDATVLVVSEETGVISVAREGKLTRYFDAKALKKLLMDLFQPAEDSSKKTLLGMFRAAPGRKAKQHEEEK